MASGKWQVRIPAGRWMAGVNRFHTKAKANAFIDRWNQVEVNSGNGSLLFRWFGGMASPVYPAANLPMGQE